MYTRYSIVRKKTKLQMLKTESQIMCYCVYEQVSWLSFHLMPDCDVIHKTNSIVTIGTSIMTLLPWVWWDGLFNNMISIRSCSIKKRYKVEMMWKEAVMAHYEAWRNWGKKDETLAMTVHLCADLNLRPPEYEAGVSTIHSEITFYKTGGGRQRERIKISEEV